MINLEVGRFFLTLVLVVTMLSGCSSHIKTSLDSEFILSTGQNARIISESMYIKFMDVIEDNRCPKNAQCIQAGKVSCDIEITKDGIKNRVILTQLGLTDNSGGYTYQNYIIVFDVTPYPEPGKTITKGDYRLLLTVIKSTK